MIVSVHCDDGTDESCYKLVDVFLNYPELSDSDIELIWVKDRKRDIVESVRIYVSSEWVKRHPNSTTKYQQESINDDGFFELTYDELGADICSACGASS